MKPGGLFWVMGAVTVCSLVLSLFLLKRIIFNNDVELFPLVFGVNALLLLGTILCINRFLKKRNL
jgi:hypothetical protein